MLLKDKRVEVSESGEKKYNAKKKNFGGRDVLREKSQFEVRASRSMKIRSRKNQKQHCIEKEKSYFF
jgi:hypothetical protein